MPYPVFGRKIPHGFWASRLNLLADKNRWKQSLCHAFFHILSTDVKFLPCFWPDKICQAKHRKLCKSTAYSRLIDRL